MNSPRLPAVLASSSRAALCEVNFRAVNQKIGTESLVVSAPGAAERTVRLIVYYSLAHQKLLESAPESHSKSNWRPVRALFSSTENRFAKVFNQNNENARAHVHRPTLFLLAFGGASEKNHFVACTLDIISAQSYVETCHSSGFDLPCYHASDALYSLVLIKNIFVLNVERHRFHRFTFHLYDHEIITIRRCTSDIAHEK